MGSSSSKKKKKNYPPPTLPYGPNQPYGQMQTQGPIQPLYPTPPQDPNPHQNSMPNFYPGDKNPRHDPDFGRSRRRRPVYEDYDSEDDFESTNCLNLDFRDNRFILPVFPYINYPTFGYGFDCNYDFMLPFYSNTCDFNPVMPCGSFF